MIDIQEILKEASEKTDKDKNNLEYALDTLKKMPEIEKPLTKVMSMMSADYLIRLITIIDKVRM